MKTILSFFDYSGNWLEPYYYAGWNVVQIDRKIKNLHDGFSAFSVDILSLNADWFFENIFDVYGTVEGCLFAPPCDDYAGSGAKHWKDKDKNKPGLFGDHYRLEIFDEYVLQCLRIVELCKGSDEDSWYDEEGNRTFFWALENPVGRIAKRIPEIGKPWFFQPYWFGDAYSKKTGLYGEFNKPEKTNEVKPTQGSKMLKMGGKSAKTKELRSITPLGFAYAFYEANH
jgi:hypothetical protein